MAGFKPAILLSVFYYFSGCFGDVRTEGFLRREHSKYKGPGMGIRPGELGEHTAPGLKSSYQGEACGR